MTKPADPPSAKSPAPAKSPVVSCPTCGKSARFSPDNPYRPFCSERCKLIDLGAWASESYRIPADDASRRDDDDDA